MMCVNCTNKSRQLAEGTTLYAKKGYILIRKPDHPRASKGLIFEHILVMEEHLGRYLLPGENIHHLNGVRSDNRFENLELWTKPQPIGVRAKDLVQWAKKILELYSDL